MGNEDYFIFVAPGNIEIRQNDYKSFSGKKVGIVKGSIQVGFYNEWAKENNVETELVELTGTEFENIEALSGGVAEEIWQIDTDFYKSFPS